MRLVMFDIDGTLTDTMKVDALCFVRAFAEVCGFGDIVPLKGDDGVTVLIFRCH